VKTVLVVANETLGGRALLDKVRERASGDDVRVVVCVPRTRPRHGNLIYDDAVFQAAQIRIDLARGVMRGEGIDAIGEVGDPDPFTATMDAISEYQPSEIIISTLPAASSGWLRRDLPERIAEASGLPVEHVVVDIDEEGLPFGVTLVVANRTASGNQLLPRLRELASSERHLFILVVPQESGDGAAAQRAQARLGQAVDRMRADGLITAGMIGDPDPYTATMNALSLFRVDSIVISTFAATRSGWLRADLIERVRKASGKPVHHVVTDQPAGTTAAA
jgi:hypothetical protein